MDEHGAVLLYLQHYIVLFPHIRTHNKYSHNNSINFQKIDLTFVIN